MYCSFALRKSTLLLFVRDDFAIFEHFGLYTIDLIEFIKISKKKMVKSEGH